METIATYRVHGDRPELTASGVTNALDLVPTSLSEREPHARPGSPGSASIWRLSTGSSPAAGIELSEQLNQLLRILEPRTDELWQLLRIGYQFDWFCYVGSHALEHALVIDRALMRRLLAIPGELLLDLYSDGTDD